MTTLIKNIAKQDTATKIGLTILFGFIVPVLVYIVAFGLKELAYWL